MPSGLSQLHRSLNTSIKKLFLKVHFALSEVNCRNDLYSSYVHLEHVQTPRFNEKQQLDGEQDPLHVLLQTIPIGEALLWGREPSSLLGRMS